MPAPAYAQSVPYNEAIKVIAANIEAKITSADIVAIAGFQSSTSQFTNRVIDDLINELVAGKARVVDRQNLERIHAEQDYQLSGYVDDNSAVFIGHELGAAVIIVGSGENMTDYYRFNFRMLSVETAEILMQSSVNVRYDSTMRRLLNDQAYNSGGIGNTHFLVGARLGAGFEINTADEDMVGSGYSPKEKSNIAFNATLFGAFKLNESWAIQPEVNFMLNNGMEISGHGNTVTIDYPTLDIPLLVRWNFILKPVLTGILAGPYISLPIGKLNLSVGDQGSALDTTGYTLGVTGGFVTGIKAGPGYITGDVRFLHDFSSLRVREDFGDGMQDANIGIRRSINLTIGYEFSL
jgi:hypothetical protein